MVVRFAWQPREWREAYLLCTTEKKQAGGPIPVAYLVMIVMLAGGMADVVHSLRHSRGAILHDRLLPVLLLVCAFAPAAAVAMAMIRHRKRFRALPATPEGEQEMIFHERGWSALALAEATTDRQVRPWSELHGHRRGRTVLAILTLDGTPAGVPLRALAAGQAGWLEQMLHRKVPS